MEGLFASAFLSAAMPHIIITGDTLPIMVLCTAVLCWLLLYVKGIESGNGMVFAMSFIFLAFALHCNAEGFLLVPASMFIYKCVGGRIKYIWFFLGIYIVMLSYLLYIDAVLSSGFRAICQFPEAWQEFWLSGGGKGQYSNKIVNFAKNYFRILGIIPGIFMIVSLAAGLSATFVRRENANHGNGMKPMIPWALLQLFGFAGLFFANKYSRFYLIYLIGACGTTTWMFKRISATRAKYMVLPLVGLLLTAMILHPYAESRSNSESRYTTLKLTRSMEEIYSRESPNAYDLNNNFHTLIEDNLRPGLIQLNAISTYMLLDSSPACDSSMKNHVLFFLKDDFESELGTILKQRFPEIEENKPYAFFKSHIDNKSWVYCPGYLGDRPYGAWRKDVKCKKFNRAFRTSFETEGYRLYPELDKDISERTPPPWKPNNVYSIYVHINGSSLTRKKLIIIETTGCIGSRIVFAKKSYRPLGREITKVSDEGVENTCTTWMEIPYKDGWLGFDWFYNPKVIDPKSAIPELFIDVIDIDIDAADSDIHGRFDTGK
jgi:hypothetical protein